MLLAARIKLEPTPEQHNLLKDTLAQANQVCNRISHQAFTQGVFRQFSVHQLVYHPAGKHFPLSSQMVIVIILMISDRQGDG